MNRYSRLFVRSPAARLLLASVLGVTLLGLAPPSALAANSSTRSANETTGKVKVSGTPLPTSDNVGQANDPAIGKLAPVLTGKNFSGKKVVIGGPGQPRMVIFLSHSCPHCQAEVPVIVKLSKQGKLDGVEIDTVTTNTSKTLPNYPPSKWLKRENWPHPTILADDSQLRGFSAYGGQAFPYFVFLDSTGTVVGRAEGELPASSIAAAAKKLAALG